MEASNILVYDGSFNGFLSAVYLAFDEPLQAADIRSAKDRQKTLFADAVEVPTDLVKAKRVWDGIERKQYQAVKKIYFVFLSERKGIEFLLFRYIRILFNRPLEGENEKIEDLMSKLDALAYLVEQEKKQVEAGFKFNQSEATCSVATIEPQFNILPLITRHLRYRYSDIPWLVYDHKRRYGLYYHQHSRQILRLGRQETELFLQQDPGFPMQPLYLHEEQIVKKRHNPSHANRDRSKGVLHQSSAA